jgi:hypothetical protein
MGGGNPSTSTNPMTNLTSSGVGVPFGWNISSGFGAIPSQSRGSSMLEGFIFPWVSTLFPGGPSLRGNFSSWGGFPFVNTSGPGDFFLKTNFGKKNSCRVYIYPWGYVWFWEKSLSYKSHHS